MQLQMRRSSEQMGRETVQAVWERLHKGFILIDQRQLDSAGWMELYNMVHFFFACEKKEGTEERRELYSLIVSFFESMCLLHCQQLNELPADAAILPEYVRRWKHYAGTARAVRGVCAYMHRFFLPACKLHDVFLMALIKWRACCFMGLEQRLFEELVTLLRNKKGEQSHSMYICQQGDDSAEDLLSGLAQSFGIPFFVHLSSCFSLSLSLSPLFYYSHSYGSKFERERTHRQKPVHKATRQQRGSIGATTHTNHHSDHPTSSAEQRQRGGEEKIVCDSVLAAGR
ncbi:Cullin-1, variant 2 [Balamuthia mandrillaris]